MSALSLPTAHHTICVFLPIVFTQAFPRAVPRIYLTIAHSLLASLVVALTLVLAMGAATKLKTPKRKATGGLTPCGRDTRGRVGWALRTKRRCCRRDRRCCHQHFRQRRWHSLHPGDGQSGMSVTTLTMPRGAAQQDAYAMADTVSGSASRPWMVWETVGAMSGGSGSCPR